MAAVLRFRILQMWNHSRFIQLRDTRLVEVWKPQVSDSGSHLHTPMSLQKTKHGRLRHFCEDLFPFVFRPFMINSFTGMHPSEVFPCGRSAYTPYVRQWKVGEVVGEPLIQDGQPQPRSQHRGSQHLVHSHIHQCFAYGHVCYKTLCLHDRSQANV